MDPTPIPIPVPVEFGPHIGDWVLIAFTGASVVTSAAVAIVAGVSARRARIIAESAHIQEMERAAVAEDLRKQQRADEVQRAYAKHLKLLAAYSRDLREWVQRRDASGRAPIDPRPSLNEVRGDLAVLHIFVPVEDRKLVFAMTTYVAKLNRLRPEAQQEYLWRLITGLRDWRAGAWGVVSFGEELREGIEAMEAAAPPTKTKK